MKIRIRFSKQGQMRFIGHLDMVRYFQKVHRRAGIDVVYSEGFSPHQKMSFAAPLSVGVLSRGEYYDLEVHSARNSSDMIRMLNEQNVEGVRILSVRRLPEQAKNCMSIVAGADYRVNTVIDQAVLDSFLQQKEIKVLKKTKKSEKEVDIRPMIYELSSDEQGVFMKIAQGSAANLKPELVIESIYRFMNCAVPENPVYERMDMYCMEEGRLISLSEIGEDL